MKQSGWDWHETTAQQSLSSFDTHTRRIVSKLVLSAVQSVKMQIDPHGCMRKLVIEYVGAMLLSMAFGDRMCAAGALRARVDRRNELTMKMRWRKVGKCRTRDTHPLSAVDKLKLLEIRDEIAEDRSVSRKAEAFEAETGEAYSNLIGKSGWLAIIMRALSSV